MYNKNAKKMKTLIKKEVNARKMRPKKNAGKKRIENVLKNNTCTADENNSE